MFDCFGPTIDCDVCGKVLNSFGCCVSPSDLAEIEKNHLCDDCQKAVTAAREQRDYLNFFKLQETIKKAEAVGITHRQMADEFECAISTIDRYLRGVSKPMPRVCVFMVKQLESMIDGTKT